MVKKVHFFLVCGALVLAIFVAFEPLLRNGFVNYDDDHYVTENPYVKGGITHRSLVWAFTSPHYSMWHPLTSLSHILDCQLFGLKPFWHHFSSLLLHIANTLLLFWVLTKMTGAFWPSAFVAAVFGLHPLSVESVAWVAERKNVLSSFFWMLTIAFYIRYTRHISVGKFLIVILVFSLGLLAKPMVVTLPFVLLLLDYWPLGRFEGVSQSQNLQQSESLEVNYQGASLRQLIGEKIPLFVLAAVVSVITFIVQRTGGAMRSGEGIPFVYRITNALVSYISYLFKMVYPVHLAVLYPHPRDSLPAWKPIISLVILIIISVAVIYSGRRRRYLVVGWLWYLGTLVPVLGLVQVGGQAMADRYTYLPLIGIFIIVAWGCDELLSRWRFRRTALTLTAAVVIASLILCTRKQLSYWQDSFTLYNHALEVTEDNFVMHNNFGGILLNQGRFEEALMHFDRALKIRPQYYNARSNKARALVDLGRVDEAIAIFTELLKYKENRADIYNYLGLAYAEKGELDLAVQTFNKALELKYDHVKAINNLGVALKNQGKIDQAVEQWQRALSLEPDYENAHYNLGLTMAQRGKYDEAIEHFNKALEVKPNWPEARYNLGCIYYRQDRLQLTIEEFTEALRLRPGYIKAGVDLAHTLLKLGRVQSAIDCYYKMLQAEPDQPELLKRLAWILATTDKVEFRNGQEAISLAQRACEITDYQDPSMLDTLAAAYAAAARFPEAEVTAEKAMVLALCSNERQLYERIQSRLGFYEAGQPYIESLPEVFSE